MSVLAAVPPPRRRLSARQQFKKVIVDAVDVRADTRFCSPLLHKYEWWTAEAKLPFSEVPGVVASGLDAYILQLGHDTIVRVTKPQAARRTQRQAAVHPLSEPLHTDLLDARAFLLTTQKSPMITEAELLATAIGLRQLGPMVYRTAECPNTHNRLMFMDRWQGTVNDDLEHAKLGRESVFPWRERPLTVLAALTMQILKLNSYGVKHHDAHWSNIVYRQRLDHGDIGFIDFDRAEIMTDFWTKRVSDRIAPAFASLFQRWGTTGTINTPLHPQQEYQAVLKEYVDIYNSWDGQRTTDLLATTDEFVKTLYSALYPDPPKPVQSGRRYQELTLAERLEADVKYGPWADAMYYHP